jgi:hypothetical protein
VVRLMGRPPKMISSLNEYYVALRPGTPHIFKKPSIWLPMKMKKTEKVAKNDSMSVFIWPLAPIYKPHQQHK